MEAVLDSSYSFSPIQQAGIPAELRSNTEQNFVLPPWPWSGHNFQCLRIPIDSCFCTEHRVAYTWDCTDVLPTGRWRRGDAGVSRRDHISLDQHLTSWSLNRVILLHTFLNSSALSFGFSPVIFRRGLQNTIERWNLFYLFIPLGCITMEGLGRQPEHCVCICFKEMPTYWRLSREGEPPILHPAS